MPGLQGKTILVIGARSGIGLAVARAAATTGMTVIAASRNRDSAQAAAESVGDGTIAMRLDLADESTIREAAQSLGGVDFIVSVAADHANGRLPDLDAADVDNAFRAKVVGPILLAKHFAPSMPPHGAIVLFSGYVSDRPTPGLTVMATTNGAVDALVPALAAEIAPVRVVGVSPGIVDSGSWDGLDDKSAFFDSVAAENPARRVGQPDDIAHAVMFAIANEFLTATTLHVDGGQRIA